MDDSSPSPRGQDAFAKTLEFKPRQRSSVSSTNSGRPTSSLRAKEGSVNRLSRVFAQDTSSSNPHDAHIQAKKPSIPTKPPSLRIPNQHALNNTASVPSHQPLSTPALTTPTQHAMEPPPSSSSNEHESSIDETSLRFQDIRARFQQESSTVKVPSPRNTVSNNRSRPTSFAPSKGYRTTLSPKPVIPINDSQSNLGARSPARNKESSSSSLPSSSVAEISKRLEKNDKAGLKRSVKELSPAPVTARPSVPSLSRPSAIPTHRKAGEPIPSRTSLSKRASNPCMASSIQPNNTGSSAASLNIPMIARSVTGNSVMSTASTASTSSSSVTGSSAKKSWHYGTAITSWFTGNHTDDAQHQSLKDSITIVSKEPVQPSAASTSPPSSSDTSFSDSLPISPQLSGRDEVGYKVIKRSKVVQELFETEKVFQSDMMLLKEVYYDQARLPDSPFTKNDVKILFSNILAIAELEDMFIALLQNACDTSQRRPSATSLSSDNDIDNTSVGMAFREMVSDP
ncbi:uncharacterized protein BYT42DRAFT_115762 [Radiomyces spectabilis]|uniref:uncharacterized protein n=1 Tax=Radiomyces spectabilis TaxID=64574 RepID=UPI002220F333|nr:uncharacterized protein BYT42DRAFT_115762 [Radiomyces spectabilis]KAI8369595.1 hypothetical protein BYT42DRAFT_115762 [Radiomyces spectabilis]